MTTRRTCLLAGALPLLVAPQWTAAQTGERVYRVGILRPSVAPVSRKDVSTTGLPRALAELGYVEGRNLVIEMRWADGDPARLPVLAKDLVQARVDVIVAVGLVAVRAALAATTTLPVVFFANFDPLALGLVPNLARPGGNLTGLLIAPDGTLAGKKLELLRAAVPHASRIGYLAPPADPAAQQQQQELEHAARALGLAIAPAEVRDGNYERAFAAIAAQRPDALFVGANTKFMGDRVRIIALAAKYRLPAIYEFREQVEDGGFMAYGASLPGLNARLAMFVDRVLKGTKPAELAIERPSKFELVVNLNTARALGLTIPQSLLLRADEVIQ